MSATLAIPSTAASASAWFASTELRRRATGYGAAVVLHALALAALLVLPPAVMREAERVGQAIEVRLYTVAGGPDAETDAPLFEPPLAGGEAGTGEASSPGGDGAEEAEADPPAAEELEPAEPVIEPEPVEPPAEARDETLSAPDAVLTVPADIAETAEAPSAPAPSTAPDADPAPSPAFTAPSQANQPIATVQPDPDPAPAPVRTGPPSFADIVARAETRLDPEDFQIIANFAGGVRGTVRENFCLSSSDANQEAFDCPEGSQLAAPQLARYGLMGLGEEPPEFLEDMDRLAFQLSQAGANDGTIGRILTSLREARREAINTPALQRSMQRDRENATDHLGVARFPSDDLP